MVFRLFNDLIMFYKIFYVIVTEILERFNSMTLSEAEKSKVIYVNFCNLTSTLKVLASDIAYEFKFQYI